MRIAFMGTPAFAVPTLDALAAAGHEIAAVYSQPPRPAGRGKALQLSPVHKRAEALGIMTKTPAALRDEGEQAAFAALDLDVAVVAAYGLILPQPILAAPRFGCLNVHASLLPRWRGAAPIQRAILAGDALTGVTIMQMERGLDTGPMLAKAETAVGCKTAGELTEELARLGANLMAELLTSFGSPAKAETRLDFAQPAEQVERQVRAFNPPGAWFEHTGERIRVLAAEIQADVLPRRREPSSPVETGSPPSRGYTTGQIVDDALTIACAEGAIRPTLIQRAGRAPMTPAELLRGFPIPHGTRLA